MATVIVHTSDGCAYPYTVSDQDAHGQAVRYIAQGIRTMKGKATIYYSPTAIVKVAVK